MEEDEDDKHIFNSWGVTSANPEDIEWSILKKVVEAGGSHGRREKNGSELQEGNPEMPKGSASRASLLRKLKSTEMIISAVEESMQEKVAIENRSLQAYVSNSLQESPQAGSNNALETSDNGMHVRDALALDRLGRLKEKRALLKQELSKLDEGADISNDSRLHDIDARREGKKKILKRAHNLVQELGKKGLKMVKFDDDLDFDATLDSVYGGLMETERDVLVRKGIQSPFCNIKGLERHIQQPGFGIDVSEAVSESDITSSISRAAQSFSEIAQARPTTKLLDVKDLPKLEPSPRPFCRLKGPLKLSNSLNAGRSDERKRRRMELKRPLPGKKWRKAALDEIHEDKAMLSDYEEQEEHEKSIDEGAGSVSLEGGLRIPGSIFSQLFDYQKVGVQWLWELHCQRAGGIIGDEMGLGKTIQIIAFLGSLHYSGLYKPSIIVCPVTLLRQWKREANKWYPGFHVEILHDSAQVSSSWKTLDNVEESDDMEDGSSHTDDAEILTAGPNKKWDSLVNRVLSLESGLLVTTYEQLRLHGEKLLDIEWGYAVLDEGHRIRNPNAEVTLVCKQLRTMHRIIMTGAPIQNKLSELWSLFDFVFPGKLGVLPVFETEFAVPITVGGYANASSLQVSTAYRCAITLRDLIMPYLLRRMKADVSAQLPKKTEHVLFCSLTLEQRAAYRAFLASSEVEQIFDGSRNLLYGIDLMRKICNHPDLLEREYSAGDPDYGNPERSGKVKVVERILKLWKEQGHRVLLFTQTQQMLDILEKFLFKLGYAHRRMDGLTPVKQRMALIDEFNESDEIFVFILTTRVGGLGTNLTGANRVIIFDPDWNPSTDMQARERAWRIGQTRDVTVYRLITRGTIEEKVYHRQIYKHFLTNKILKSPQQRRFFKAKDLKDLFILQDEEDSGLTETSNIFGHLLEGVNVNLETHKWESQQSSPEHIDLPSEEGITVLPENGASEQLKKDDQGNRVNEEAEVLRNLFDAYGLHSAMDHDAIMDAHEGEKAKVEEQASRVAQRAAEALRQSRFLRSQDGVSVPTWTGRAGIAGAPSSIRNKFGATVNTKLLGSSKPPEGMHSGGNIHPAAGTSSGKALSSGDLLAKIRETQQRSLIVGSSTQTSSTSAFIHRASKNRTSQSSSVLHKRVQPEILIRQLCTFIQLQGGSTTSSLVVRHFKDKIPAADLTLFKNLLKEIATLEKDQNTSTRWVLKPEYKH